MRNRWSAGLTVATACSLILAGCSKGEPVKSSNETSRPSPSAAPSSTAPDAQGKKYKGEIVVSINADPNAHLEKAFDAVAEAYKKVQPDVKLIWEPGGSTEYAKWLGTQLAVGTPRPDIVSSNYQENYARYVNLDKYRKKVNPYTGNKWDQDIDFDFYAARNAKGERIMLPTQAVHIMWFYNKDIFDKLGLKPPKTWDELVSVSEKIKASGVTPIATQFGWKLNAWLPEIYADQYARNWHEIVRAQKGDYNYDDALDGAFKFDPKDPQIDLKYNYNPVRFYKGIKDGTIRFDTPQFTNWIANLAKVFPKYAQQDVFVTNDNSDYTLWLQQKAAMFIDGTRSLSVITKDMQNLNDPKRLEALKIKDAGALKPFAWGTFENPEMTGAGVQGPVRSVESSAGQYIGIIDKNQEQTNMVADFTMFWLSKAGYQAWIDGQEKAGILSLSGPLVIRGVNLPDDVKNIFKDVKMLGNAEIPMNNILMDGGVKDLETEMRSNFKDALEGKMSAEEFGKKLQALYTNNFNQIITNAGLTPDNIDHPEKAPGK
ncbi:MAG: carbohydrate ABC transporter substrate-binding protein [Paenibacillaceae bacterium]|nr:carbohydrate ABC transporter substrate-binding protein [Paenibacillaceae bacterium]